MQVPFLIEVWRVFSIFTMTYTTPPPQPMPILPWSEGLNFPSDPHSMIYLDFRVIECYLDFRVIECFKCITFTVIVFKLSPRSSSALSQGRWHSLPDTNLSAYMYLKRKKSLIPFLHPHTGKVLTYAPRHMWSSFFYYCSSQTAPSQLSGRYPQCFIHIWVITHSSPCTACPKPHICGFVW